MSAGNPFVGQRDHDEFPVNFTAFASRIKGTPNEVWTKLLKIEYGSAKMLISEWRSALETLKNS